MPQPPPQSGASPPRRRLRLGVLISGGGTTLENLITRIQDGRLRGVEIGLVISSRADVRGVEIARAAGLPVEIIRRRDFAGETPEAGEAGFSSAIAGALDRAGAELVIFAGFLCFWRVPERYMGRVLNIHPALLPAFGGRGFHGHHVHAAVLAAGVRESGCTVHLVDNEYDHGPILGQIRVPVQEGDTPERLAERVMTAERELYPRIIQHVADEGLAWLRPFQSGESQPV